MTAARRFAKSQIPRGIELEGFDLRPPEIHLLFTIEKGGLSKGQDPVQAATQPSILAGMMGVTAGNVTQIITALEKRGLIEREIDPDDRRKVMISLTASGKEAVGRATRAYREAYSGFLSELGEEKTEEFARLLERAAAYFDARFGSDKPGHP